jgi:hypothetical protein
MQNGMELVLKNSIGRIFKCVCHTKNKFTILPNKKVCYISVVKASLKLKYYPSNCYHGNRKRDFGKYQFLKTTQLKDFLQVFVTYRALKKEQVCTGIIQY